MFRNHETIWAGIKWALMQLLPLRYAWAGSVSEPRNHGGEVIYPAACVWRQWFGRVLWAKWYFDRSEVARIEQKEKTGTTDEIRELPTIRCAEV